MKDFYGKTISSMDVLFTKCPGVKAALQPYRDNMASVMASIPELGADDGDDKDGKPGAATQFAITQMGVAAEQYNRLFAGLPEVIAGITGNFDSRVTAEISGKITRGDLVTREKYDADLKAAREDGDKKLALLTSRRKEILTASLPTPVDEGVLLDEAFPVRIEEAKKRAEELKDRKFDAAILASLVWADQGAYELATATMKAAGGGKRQADPLAGGGSDGEKEEEKRPRYLI